MDDRARTQMGTLLRRLQEVRALTDLDVVAQLNQIQRAHQRGRRSITVRLWQYWKSGHHAPRPFHRRVVAEWAGVTVAALTAGRAVADWKGEITIEE